MLTSTSPELLIDSGAVLPRVWIMSSTATSSEIAYVPAVEGVTVEQGVGFFRGIGEGSGGLRGLGMRLGDVVVHVSQATLATTLAPQSFSGITTLHSVIRCTADGSTYSSSVAFDVTLSQASLG